MNLLIIIFHIIILITSVNLLISANTSREIKLYFLYAILEILTIVSLGGLI